MSALDDFKRLVNVMDLAQARRTACTLAEESATLVFEIVKLQAELDAAHVRDIRDEHTIAELRNDVATLRAQIDEAKDAAMEMNQGEDL